jgi:hypothetical protein
MAGRGLELETLSVNHFRENGSCALARNNAPKKSRTARNGAKSKNGLKTAQSTPRMRATNFTDFADSEWFMCSILFHPVPPVQQIPFACFA